MYLLITYDVNTETPVGKRRLYKVAKICKDYGQRVQNSVFECILDEVQLTQLKVNLTNIINNTNDSIRIYYLNKNESRRVETIGKNRAIDIEKPLIL